MEKVVNVGKRKGIRPYFDIYIGRRVTAWGVKDFPKDSKWHNPYTVKEFGLEKSLELYENTSETLQNYGMLYMNWKEKF